MDERAQRWAGRYVNETDVDPTDEEMARVFAPCVGTCPTELYPEVRAAVYAWREENGKKSRLEPSKVAIAIAAREAFKGARKDKPIAFQSKDRP